MHDTLDHLLTECDPGPALYRAVRSLFVMRGSSLNYWCVREGVSRQWARQALLGKERGRAAGRLVMRITGELLEPDNEQRGLSRD